MKKVIVVGLAGISGSLVVWCSNIKESNKPLYSPKELERRIIPDAVLQRLQPSTCPYPSQNVASEQNAISGYQHCLECNTGVYLESGETNHVRCTFCGKPPVNVVN